MSIGEAVLGKEMAKDFDFPLYTQRVLRMRTIKGS